MRITLIILAAVGLAGCTVSGPGEFVCETHGELTERHVNVASARIWDSRGAMVWRLKYTDGDGAARYYLQREGETCALEVLP